MNIISTAITGVFVVTFPKHLDSRGQFGRLYCNDELGEVLNGRQIAQANLSVTTKVGAIRGMHFQYPPHAEMKFIRCLKGRVWDVAVDLRKGSPTFLQWHAEELSGENDKMIVLPEGIAHGFQVLSPDSEMLYLHTTPYKQAAEGRVRYDDHRINITWPLPVTDLSVADSSAKPLDQDFLGVTP